MKEIVIMMRRGKGFVMLNEDLEEIGYVAYRSLRKQDKEAFEREVEKDVIMTCKLLRLVFKQ